MEASWPVISVREFRRQMDKQDREWRWKEMAGSEECLLDAVVD